MKILAVNKFYYIKGGAESYYFSLNELFRKEGHEIIPFSMKDKKNIQSDFEKYFINNIDYNNMSFKEKINNTFKIIYSTEARRKIKSIIKDNKPDIAHLHNFQHQMSPSILKPIKKSGIPIMVTVHDLKIICPNYKMLNKKGICEECKGNKYYNCLANSCTKNSRMGSAVNMVESYLHKFLKSYSYIDKFICPSDFYRRKFIEFGIPKEKVIHIPNFVDVQEFEPCYEDNDYFVYIGRLSEEKGIKTLINAMKQVKASKLAIIGTGPLEEELKNQVKELGLKNVEFLGFKSGKALEEAVRYSKFTIITSEWYENCPMSVIEAMAYGKAVIGSDLGGIPELIEDCSTGLIYKSGNAKELADKINYLVKNPEISKAMGKAGRVRAEKLYDKKIHFKKINEVYKELMK